jgi:hypothetical protein
MRLPSKIPTSELDKLFDIEPDKNQEPMDNEWYRQQEREIVVSKWISELEHDAQMDFLRRLETNKRRRRR